LARQALLPPQPEVLDIKIWRVFWVDGHGFRPVRRRGLRVNADAVAVAVLLLQGRDVRCIISVGVYAHRTAGGVRFKPMQGRFGLIDLAGGDGWRSGS